MQNIALMNDKTFPLRISRGELAALKKRARAEGVSQGSLVRRALRAHGVTAEATPRKTGYDVIRPLLGRNHGGAKDLSTNPKHLADCGE